LLVFQVCFFFDQETVGAIFWQALWTSVCACKCQNGSYETLWCWQLTG